LGKKKRKQKIIAEDRIWQIAKRAEEILGIEGFAETFENFMSKGFYSLSSPIWSNFGKDRGLPISCFSSYIPDEMSGILYKLGEVGMMSKAGGGTSGYFGDIRPRGAPISSGGSATGVHHQLTVFNSLVNYVSQGNVRRGSFAAYLDIDHPDIEEFLRIRSDGDSIQDLSIGVCVSDEWMKSMIDGDSDKRKIWGKVIKKRFESGYPYIFFTDNANNNKPQVYKDKDCKIHNSNLCVAGDQRVVSDRGILTAKELYEQGGNLKLFDNDEIVDSSEMKLIEKDADLYKVTLENGMSHKITSYHKLVKVVGDINETEITECKDLKIGDKILIQTKKGIFGTLDRSKEALLLGLYQADGTQYKDNVCIDIWENDFDLEDEIISNFSYMCEKYNSNIGSNNRVYDSNFTECYVSQSNVRKRRLSSKAFKKSLVFEKGFVPSWIWESNEKTLWQYIRGLFFADGTAYMSNSKGNPLQIALASIDKEFLSEIQIILANLGMQSSIRILRKAGKSLLPDGKGGEKFYETKDCWRLIIGNKNDALVFEKNTGFLSRKGIIIEDRDYRDNTKKCYKISSIEHIGKEDVFCVEVKNDKHLWVCNGFVTHNCSEIFLPTNENESFVCNLSSINLERWDEIKDTNAVEILIYFLDAVMTEFIDKTEPMEFMEHPRNFAINHRALGLGVLGWHSFLQSKMIAFESFEAKMLNSEIFKTISEKSEKASRELAQKLGEPPLLEGYGLRNTTTMAIAPTTSSSFILGQVSPSIEPLNSNYFVKDLAKGKFTFKNPYLISLLESKGQNTQEIWKTILIKGGSVQHLDFLSEEEKNVFKTFGELSQKEIIIQAAQRQKYIDQGQSLNIMIPPTTKPKDVNELMIFAWEQGVKSLYYQRSANPAQELARNILDCQSCSS
jgi:ribonucleoside-diphosphate reductase alpha chain